MMKRPFTLWTALAVGTVALLTLGARELSAQAGFGAAAPAAAVLGAAELDQLTAPIALYSDPLLGAVLAAATYPLEVVEASRWRDDPAHAALNGDELSAALQQQNWDPSVKSLAQFPDVLHMMNNDLQWTERLGDAFLAQQADVMASVQRLRQRAAAAGSLRSTPQQSVASEGQNIAIEPSSPDVVYEPYYDPNQVYGAWPWPDYPPVYFAAPAGVYFADGFMEFGTGIGIVGPYWGWYGWDWGHRGFNVLPGRGRPPGPPRPWLHDPSHRRGVPYRDAAVAIRYLGGAAVTHQGFRGYAPTDAPRGAAGRPAEAAARPYEPSHTYAPAPARLDSGARLAPPQRAEPERYAPAAAAPPPAYESFGRGSDVRNESTRGTSSRSAAAPHAAPAPHGGRPPHR